ncbi:MAG: hypothetical protein ACI4MQ_03820 [Candidatus Coproplasma sp.]
MKRDGRGGNPLSAEKRAWSSRIYEKRRGVAVIRSPKKKALILNNLYKIIQRRENN